MKKISVFVLLAILILSFCACNDKKQANVYDDETVQEKYYTSDFTGFKFTATQDWEFFSDERLAEHYNISIEDLNKDINDVAISYDLFALNKLNGTTVSAMFENMNLLYGGPMEEEAYLQKLIDNRISEHGAENVTADPGKITIDGTEFNCVNFQTKYEIVLQEIVVVKKVDNHMALLSIEAMNETKLNEALDRISLIQEEATASPESAFPYSTQKD